MYCMCMCVCACARSCARKYIWLCWLHASCVIRAHRPHTHSILPNDQVSSTTQQCFSMRIETTSCNPHHCVLCCAIAASVSCRWLSSICVYIFSKCYYFILYNLKMCSIFFSSSFHSFCCVSSALLLSLSTSLSTNLNRLPLCMLSST